MDPAAVEIGRTLRDARERQGLELGDAERATRIRASYLAALEDERFDRLPERAYAKSFLREYARFLGLDDRRLAVAFDALIPASELPDPVPAMIERRPMRPRLRPVALTVSALAAAVVGVLAWQLGGPDHTAAPATPTTRTHPAAPAAAHHRKASPAKTTALRIHVLLRARGPCWLSIRSGSATGPVLYEATLPAGGALRYTLAPTRPKLWMRIGAPWNLELSLNSRQAGTLSGAVPTNVLVSARGVQSSS